MARPAERTMTAAYRGYLEASEFQVAEILDGELVLSPRPAPKHARAILALGALLEDPFNRGVNGPGGWIILPEPELHIVRNKKGEPEPLAPDLAGWRRTRMAEVPEEPAIELAPDWTCEIWSPGNKREDRERKPGIYARAGIPRFWSIELRARTLEVFKNIKGDYVNIDRFAGNDVIKAEPFEMIALNLGRLWAT